VHTFDLPLHLSKSPHNHQTNNLDQPLILTYRSYFNSKFHIFDAFVIILGFTMDVLLRGPLEEAASLIVILRLWRVFKIIEELSVGASEQIDHLSEQLEMLQGENEKLREEVLQDRRKFEGESGKLKREIKGLKRDVDFSKKQGEGSKMNMNETPPTPD
jgi:hypothetical protein